VIFGGGSLLSSPVHQAVIQRMCEALVPDRFRYADLPLLIRGSRFDNFRVADHPGDIANFIKTFTAAGDQYRRPRGVSDGRALTGWLDRRSGVPGGAWNILALQSKPGKPAVATRPEVGQT
jgi:hypothetical protein